MGFLVERNRDFRGAQEIGKGPQRYHCHSDGKPYPPRVHETLLRSYSKPLQKDVLKLRASIERGHLADIFHDDLNNMSNTVVHVHGHGVLRLPTTIVIRGAAILFILGLFGLEPFMRLSWEAVKMLASWFLDTFLLSYFLITGILTGSYYI